MVAVINFGGQYAHLIARRIRQLGVKSELISPDVKLPDLKKLNPQALILSGSPYSVYEKKSPKLNIKIYNLKLPILGICYGLQLIAYQLGGKVSSRQTKQFGKEILIIKNKSPLFENLLNKETVWFSHGDQVDKLPRGFDIIASTKNAKIAAFQNLQKKLFGIQFHPEVSHTPKGEKILRNFLFKIAKARKDWDLTEVKMQIVKKIKTEVGNDKVLVALSGGVDSLVATCLIREALGSNLYPIFIDTGLLRQYDIHDFRKMVKILNFKNVQIIKAQDRFLKILKGVVDPEEKRRKIARVYFEILEEEAKKIGNVIYLGQGTIYPDRIESAQTSKHADKIKSHHNVTLPHGLKLKIVEPLAELYKDEVRTLGRILNVPDSFLNRHPFPGPGLGIRILGEVTKERLEIVRAADEVFISELKSAGLYNIKEGSSKMSQALAAILPVKSVGVMGDARTYSYMIALRCVDTVDFMTADWSKIPNEVLEKVSSRIVNEVRGVNRVVYDITQKPPATIEYE
ncbi:glutamine-hydrolyzing GMP synthase [Candidatus Curtissbacteria bacterium RIFCSPLOWO2_01_FULL_38_11b]|uniref:GMP synthase [glutamine-hydrolyzing] n=1 Tax=Candidatus Curtissbacteria bacterium RIFCSPLOWO2_01_FULL_38_11b TaxID=1797725 RepID=A0A1F5H2V9_9BACT|nr:MAG: glutamine-hydrolyzing GMP synthase [Candidatus Curtissbacteria bacterium RIFCSPLOWO2_01_FULL_38_11b]